MSAEGLMIDGQGGLKLKQGLTWEEKVKICERWRSSGLSKVMYCKKNQLILSTFCGWCGSLWPKVGSNQLCRVAVLEGIQKKEMASPITIELTFSNQMAARVSLHEDQVLDLLKGLVYATSTPR